ncbi:MAG: hypothetical protein R6W70_01660 [bacterium]
MNMKERIQASLTSMSDREKKIFILFAFVVYFFVTFMTYYFLSGKIENEKKSIAEKKNTMIEMSGMKNAYQRVQNEKERVLRKIKNNKTNLTSYISGIKEAVGVNLDTIKDMKHESMENIKIEQIEIGMRKISLPLLMSLLYNAEDRNRYIFIRSVRIDSRYDKQDYNASVIVGTLKEGEEE